MLYAEARSLILDGDLIGERGKTGLLTPFTRFFTRSDYTHTGTAIWVDDVLMMAEINLGGNHLVPLSQLDGVDFDVFECPVPDRAAVRKAVFDVLRIHLDYSGLALVITGLLNFFSVKFFLHARKLYVCSGLSTAIYEVAGWTEHTHLLSPKELTGLLDIKLEVRAV